MNDFRVGFSADFCDAQGKLVFPDIGLSLLEGIPHDFVGEYRAEYSPDQLSQYDVLITLKPKITAQSLLGVSRLCAIGRCGVGYDNVDLEACTQHGIAVYITPAGVVRPVAEAIVLFVLALSHHLIRKDRQVRQGCGRKVLASSAASHGNALSAPLVWETSRPKRCVCCESWT